MDAKLDDTSFSHLDADGRARMVDVSEKSATLRQATAEGRVRVSPALAEAIAADQVAKGNVLEVARLAGIMAAKRTAELIPLCHPLPLDHVNVEARLFEGAVHLRATARTTAATGVEIEALTAVATAALTIIDMGKALDPAMIIEHVRLVEKSGGRRGRLTPHPSEFPS